MKSELVVKIGQNFLQRSYLWSIICFVILSALVIGFEFPDRLDPIVFLFYILIIVFFAKLVFLHGLEYRLDSKMIFVENHIIPWQRTALWRDLKDIRCREIFKNRFYHKGYFDVRLYFENPAYEAPVKIHLNSSLSDFEAVLCFIEDRIQSQKLELNPHAEVHLRALIEKCHEEA